MTKDIQKKQGIGIVKKQDILENQAKKVYLGIGSNLGNRIKNIDKAKYLIRSFNIKILKSSSYYKTESWPNKSFPYYINVVILISTHLDLIQLYKKIKFIEKKIGRVKMPRNYPRVCDIDIIDFNGIVNSINYKNNKIVTPHERMHKRNFVLLPLNEINKSWEHPKYKKNIVNLLSKLPILDLRSINLI